jgi:hypothetical protein
MTTLIILYMISSSIGLFGVDVKIIFAPPSQYKGAGSASPLISERCSTGKARTLTPFKKIEVASVLKYTYKINTS